MLSIYAITHFLVDFSCANLIFSSFTRAEEWYLLLLLYNFFAFAMQMPLGILADRWNRNRLCASIGCVLVGCAYFMTGMPMVACIVAGVGNGLFHLGGGIEVLNQSGRRCAPLGIFIAPGSLGIAFGSMAGKARQLHPFIPVIALLVGAGLIAFLRIGKARGSWKTSNPPLDLTPLASRAIRLTAFCLFAVVILRSFVGYSLTFSWKTNPLYAYWLMAAVFLGKCGGGFLADRIGPKWGAALSLGLAIPLFLLGDRPWFGIAAVFLFNMTMPITLWALAETFPKAKGFAFGILTFAIFLGLIPMMLNWNVRIAPTIVYAIASGISIMLLFAGLRKYDSDIANLSADHPRL